MFFKNWGELMRIFVDTSAMEQSAHFGWQNKDEALYGLWEGYKNNADELVEMVINSGGNPKILDTFIFSILFSYSNCLGISLKHIYESVEKSTYGWIQFIDFMGCYKGWNYR